MAYHFGQEIKKIIKKKGMTISEFARRINKSRENAYDIFTRKSLDTDLLKSISQVLDYDFMAKSIERNKAGNPDIVSDTSPFSSKAEQELYLIREELLILRKEMIALQTRLSQLEKPARRKPGSKP
jgi:transcriptional regulator with XRE-family HTH domain